MVDPGKRVFSLARLSEGGQVTIPAEYRRSLALSNNSAIVLVQVGDALVLAPYDDELAEVTGRLEARLSEAGLEVEDLIAAANKARSDITREEFGEEDPR